MNGDCLVACGSPSMATWNSSRSLCRTCFSECFLCCFSRSVLLRREKRWRCPSYMGWCLLARIYAMQAILRVFLQVVGRSPLSTTYPYPIGNEEFGGRQLQSIIHTSAVRLADWSMPLFLPSHYYFRGGFRLFHGCVLLRFCLLWKKQHISAIFWFIRRVEVDLRNSTLGHFDSAFHLVS